LPLSGSLRLNGQVRDTSGAAVPSARLRFSGPAYTQAAADAHGYFTTYLPLPDGVSTASLITEATSAGSSGYGQHTQNLSLSETGIIAISYDLVIEPRTNPPGNDLRTERTVIFTGQVQNALVAGMGLGQVSVRISAPGAISRDVCQTTTRSGGEDSGTFECQATLLTDEPFSATITTSNFGSTTTIIDVTADDLPLPGTSTRLDVGTLLNSPRTLQLSGQMTADGVFTANLTMSALSHGYQFGTTQTVTSADGSYSAVMALPDAAPASLDLRYWATVVTPRGVVEVGHTREVTMDGVSGLYSVAQDLTIATRLTLNGRVIVETATHAPVSEGLRVVVSTPDIGQLCQTTTSAQGSFTCTTANDIPVPRSGELELQFTVSQGTTQLTVPISQTFTVSAGSGIIVRLNPEVRIKTTIIELSGTVVNNLGEGVSGVKVAVQGTLTKESTTAQDGSYSIFGMVAEDVTDATLNLTATPPAPDHNLAESTSFTLSLTPQALNQYVQIIELTKRNIQLSGVVSNRFLPGEPVGQTRVRFYEGDRLVCNRTTSSSGRFDCSGFVPSAHTLEILELTYYIDGPAYDQGIIVLSEEQLPTTGRSGTALLDLSAAQSTLRLSGIVTDISGTPIQGATVEITLGNTIHLMTTDIQGGYSHIVAGTGRWWPAIAITYEGSIVSRSLDIIGEPYMLTEHTENFILGSDAPGTSRWVIETGHNRVEGLALGHDERIYLIAATNSIREVMALDDNGSVLWRYPVTTERWDNTLVIGHEGTIFFAEAQGLWNTNKSGNLRALNPDGTLKWSVEFNALPSLPAIAADGTVVIGLSNSQIAALNPETGAVLWTYQATHGDMSQNRVVIGANGTVLAIAQVDWSNRELIALDANGQLMWQLDQVRQVVAFGDNDVTYVGRRSDDCWCEDFIALDSNGAVLWSYNIWESISTVTVAANGTLFVHSGYEGRAYTAINPDGTLLAELYSLEGSNYYADTSSAAIGTDGIIYEPEGRAIYAFTADDTLLWEFGIVGWQATTPVITTNGRLIVGDSTGRVYAINTTASGLAGSPWPRAGGNNQNTGRAR
jgi:outer membrane protein assembly factor BamB